MTNQTLKGTKTEQLLLNAYAGESMARNRYTYFAQQAKNDGYEQIAEIFCLTADNEVEHAKLFYKFLGNMQGHVASDYPFELGSTAENLQSAAEGEKEEWSILYALGEQTAKEEGFDDIAITFHYVIEAEKHHEQRFLQLLENLKNNSVFAKENDTKWMCRKCGYVCTAKAAPVKCPNCRHPQAYFQVYCEQY